MPALAASQDPQMLQQAAKAMAYIIGKQIELSGSSSAKDLGLLWEGDMEAVDERDARIGSVEETIHSVEGGMSEVLQMNENALLQMQEQISMLAETQSLILDRLGANPNTSGSTGGTTGQGPSTQATGPTTVMPASA
jgi:hypothetical protein